MKILKDPFGKPMSQAEAARILEMSLATYVAYEKGTARKISRAIAEKASATWHVSPDYLMQVPPKGDPVSIAGDALTPEDALRASMKRLFGFDTWNGQRRTTELAELVFLNIHGALHRLSWGSYFSLDKKPARPPTRYRELKERFNAGEKLSDAEQSELEMLGNKRAKRKEGDFKRLRSKGHETVERFLFDVLAAIHDVLTKYNLPREAPPTSETRYTPILEDILEDPEAPIVGPNGKPIDVRPSEPLPDGWKTIQSSALALADAYERELLRLRQEYRLMVDDKSWEEWRPKLERLALKRVAKRRSARQSTEEV